MDDTIACKTEADTFLASTPVKPMRVEKRKYTQKELEKQGEELDKALDNPMPENFFESGGENTLASSIVISSVYVYFIIHRTKLFTSIIPIFSIKKKCRHKKRTQKKVPKNKKNSWQRLIFAYTIVSAEGLNFCVRDGNRCTTFAIVTKKIYLK